MFYNQINPDLPVIEVAGITHFADTICQYLYPKPCAAAVELFQRNLAPALIKRAGRPGPIVLRVGPFSNQTQIVCR